jgi:signal recognition particle subunit SEC65
MNTSSNTIAEIRSAIESLEYKLRCWRAECGDPRSNMKRSDVAFLERQIAKLEKLEAKVNADLDAVLAAVKTHTENW